MENKNKIIMVLAIGLLLIIQTLISVPIINYYSKGVAYEFKAEVQQCRSALDNYNDKLPDFVNNERTNTDNLAINNRRQFNYCRKIIDQPEHYLKEKYISFWITTATTQVLVAIFIILLGILVMILINNKMNEEKEDIYEDWY